ncbi:hypothetical protein ACO1D1_14245, partial [Neobacillus sp. 19]
VMFIYFVGEAIFNPKFNNLDRRFRIYRETLSRFSCTTSNRHYAYYSNDELHDILIEAQTETDQAKRNELYKKAQEIVHEDAPWVPLVHSTPLLAASKDVLNYIPHPTGSECLSKVEFK